MPETPKLTALRGWFVAVGMALAGFMRLPKAAGQSGRRRVFQVGARRGFFGLADFCGSVVALGTALAGVMLPAASLSGRGARPGVELCLIIANAATFSA
jgi:hypothetical protein